MLGLDQLSVNVFLKNINIRYVDNAYLNNNVLYIHNDTYQKLGDMIIKKEIFDIWEWCYENLNIIHYDNSIEIDLFIKITENSDTFAYQKTKLY